MNGHGLKLGWLNPRNPHNPTYQEIDRISVYHPFHQIEKKVARVKALEAQAQEGAEGAYESSAEFPVDERYHITLKIMRADCSAMQEISCLAPVKILADTGADITLLTRETADELGYELDRIREVLPVTGMNGGASNFKVLTTWCQLGNMKPIQVPIAFAVDEDGLEENLLGRRGFLDTGRLVAIYASTGVEYRVASPRIASGSFL